MESAAALLSECVIGILTGLGFEVTNCCSLESPLLVLCACGSLVVAGV